MSFDPEALDGKFKQVALHRGARIPQGFVRSKRVRHGKQFVALPLVVSAATAVTTTATAAAAAATATTAVPTTAPAGTPRALARFVNRDGATIHLGPIECLDGSLASVVGIHLHEPKPARAARFSIGNHLGRLYGAMRAEQRLQRCRRGRPREISDVNLLGHHKDPLHFAGRNIPQTAGTTVFSPNLVVAPDEQTLAARLLIYPPCGPKCNTTREEIEGNSDASGGTATRRTRVGAKGRGVQVSRIGSALARHGQATEMVPDKPAGKVPVSFGPSVRR